ncbi:MAG: GGDEF domain-containing protein [Actinomycetota bacterium]|nr:GGDEF domain-containing protein [Actinomycetota bacterium]
MRGPSFGDIYYLDAEPSVLGSDPFRAELVVRDIEVAPMHAKVCLDPRSGGYVLQDLGGGTAVNEREIEESCPLECGDRIFVGDSVMEFVEHDPLREHFHKNIQRLINQDHLTGLLAKNRFDEQFERSLEFARERELPLSVLMADIDNLKKINDTYGHLFGEFTVAEIGHLIQESLDSEESYATRFGGDEYQVVLPNLTKDEAVEVAEEIRRRVEGYVFEHDGVIANPTLSLGAASYPEDGDDRGELTRAADEALYRAKDAGGNTVHK